jgi:hypothetical protein
MIDFEYVYAVLSKKIPKFEESLDGKQTRRRKSKNFEIFKQRYLFLYKLLQNTILYKP